jgi:hypothetical protein
MCCTQKKQFLLGNLSGLPYLFPPGTGGFAAAQVAHLMVKIHHGLHFHKQAWMQYFQPFVDVLVYAAFAQAKAPGRLAYGIAGGDDMPCQHQASGLDLMTHPFSSPFGTEYEGEGRFMPVSKYAKRCKYA